MRRAWLFASLISGLFFCAVLPVPVFGCSLCVNVQQSLTLRQEASNPAAKLIVAGTLSNPRVGVGGTGATDMAVEGVFREHAFIKDKKTLTVPRYLPVDPKNPPQFLLFCDIFQDKLDPYRGIPVKSKEMLGYLQGAMKIPPEDSVKALQYCADFLEHPDKAVSEDAFLEFAKANDRDIGAVANRIPAGKVRGWLKDPQVPAERLGLYGFLLGASGSADDAELLRSLLVTPTERTTKAFDGLLVGYIALQPKDGWELAYSTLKDNSKPFHVHLAVVRAVRFLHGWKPKEHREQILKAQRHILERNDLADLAMQDLRRRQEWELTQQVLSLYGKKGYTAPIITRSLVCYALSCPLPEAKLLVETIKQKEPELVQDMKEALSFEKNPIK